MPKTEKALDRLVYKYNITRAHHRSLYGEYGYNHILNSDLVSECLNLYDLKKTKIRVLDVGCGDGFALSQLKDEIDRKGAGGNFEFFGLGLNLYEKMYIPRKSFIKEGIFDYQLNTQPFDFIISVYTFQYIWHKLEALENIYNSLMSDAAKAIIHFPGYLVSFSEGSSEILQSESDGNRKLLQFMNKWNSTNTNPQLKYDLVPYNSDDDDQIMFTEFGNLRFQKEKDKKLDFNAYLSGFSIYDEGFISNNLNRALSYVSSIYNFRPPSGPAVPGADRSKGDGRSNKKSSLCRIVTMRQKFKNNSYHFHLGIHPLKSKVIIGIYPAAKEELTGSAVPYREIAGSLQTGNVGAVVRCNGLYDPSVNFHEFNDFFARLFVDYILRNSKEICGTSRPKIYLMGYSSGGSGIASIASEFGAIRKMLLIAPSYDADKTVLQNSINNYKGELYIVTGDQDQVVLPSQVAWFYFQAKKVKIRKFVELVSCDHSFSGFHNKDTISKSPFWAFNGCQNFPREEVMSEM